MKLVKVEVYISDLNDDYKDSKEMIESLKDNKYLSIDCFNIEETEVEWNDNIDINMQDCPVENFRKYFNKSNNK